MTHRGAGEIAKFIGKPKHVANNCLRNCRRLQSSDAVLAISALILLMISENGICGMLTIFDPVLAIIAACSQSSAPAHAICN
jgi:hypothetical protein